MKICTRCNKKQEIEEFHNDKNSKDGKRSHCRTCISIANKAWQARNPEHARACWMKSFKKNYSPDFQHKRKLKSYKISQSDFDSLIDFNSGNCHICNLPLADIPHIDHCHATGMVRGMLCLKCNTALGSMKDNPILLRKAAEYVESSGFCKFGSQVFTGSISPS